MKISEKKRLETVRQFELLNFNNNKELNDLVVLALEICNMPMALISLTAEYMQLVKCRSGINVADILRGDSFCSHLLNKKGVMVVHDTLLDKRFANNPAVTGKHAIRFYAGAPLITSNGHHLGALCVLDQKPRLFSKKQKDMLAILSRQVMHLMELQMSLKLIEVHNEVLSVQQQKIASQNKSLLSIAYIQSHEYRRPVASIMGLMNIIRDYNYKASKKCLMMMEEAVNELDEKIRNVVNYTSDSNFKYNELDEKIRNVVNYTSDSNFKYSV